MTRPRLLSARVRACFGCGAPAPAFRRRGAARRTGPGRAKEAVAVLHRDHGDVVVELDGAAADVQREPVEHVLEQFLRTGARPGGHVRAQVVELAVVVAGLDGPVGVEQQRRLAAEGEGVDDVVPGVQAAQAERGRGRGGGQQQGAGPPCHVGRRMPAVDHVDLGAVIGDLEDQRGDEPLHGVAVGPARLLEVAAYRVLQVGHQLRERAEPAGRPRNAPSRASASSTAGNPLPLTSPIRKRTPAALLATAYRSPPICAYGWEAW